jgi:periplasmic mercuric ion binding protein
MKKVKLFITAMIVAVFAIAPSAQAQNMNMKMASSRTESFKVWGNCEMCKTRIENAVKADGATSANWDISTKMLAVTFDPKKTSIESLSKTLAGVGHDTENLKADDKVYDALPECCKYERTTAKMVVDYTCPMHSDVHSDKPGKCPICDMALVKKEISKPDNKDSQQSMHEMHSN